MTMTFKFSKSYDTRGKWMVAVYEDGTYNDKLSFFTDDQEEALVKHRELIQAYEKEAMKKTFPKLEPSSRVLLYDREIDADQPDTFAPSMEDVFRALPKINRFNGQTISPYSVAAHSLMCEKVAREVYYYRAPHLLLAVLLHDASEAYVGDIVRPMKRMFKGFAAVEANIMSALFNVIGFTYEEQVEINADIFTHDVKEIDTRMAATEADVLTAVKIVPNVPRFKREYVSHETYYLNIEYAFRIRYHELMIERSQHI